MKQKFSGEQNENKRDVIKTHDYHFETSTMWPSQNDLLYNGTEMQMIKKEKKIS